MVALAKRSRRQFLPRWRAVRSALDKEQIFGCKGCVLSTHFVSIIQSFGVPLSKDEVKMLVRTFRRDRDESVVQYDDFLRLCYASKSVP